MLGQQRAAGSEPGMFVADSTGARIAVLGTGAIVTIQYLRLRKKRLDRRPRHPAQADRDQYTPLRSLAGAGIGFRIPARTPHLTRSRVEQARKRGCSRRQHRRSAAPHDRSATRAIVRPGPAFVRTRLSVQLRAVLLSRSAGRTPSPEPSATPRPTAERACRAYEGTCRSRQDACAATKAELSTGPIWLPQLPRCARVSGARHHFRFGPERRLPFVITHNVAPARRPDTPNGRRTHGGR